MFLSIPKNTEKRQKYEINKLKSWKVTKSIDKNLVNDGKDGGDDSCADGDGVDGMIELIEAAVRVLLLDKQMNEQTLVIVELFLWLKIWPVQ